MALTFRSSPQRGFTLVEILVVVALIGVVSAIAVPMMGNTLGFFRLSGDARSTANSIALAKMRASSVFGRVRLYVDLGGEQVPHGNLRQDHVDVGPGRRHDLSVATRELRIRRRRHGAAEYHAGDWPGAALQEQRGATRRYPQHRVHHLQLARTADRLDRRAEQSSKRCTSPTAPRSTASRCRPPGWSAAGALPLGDAHIGRCNENRCARASAGFGMKTARRSSRRPIACGVLLVTLAGLMSMGTLATMHTENQGHLAPRTTEYAQDKMEQLLALAYGDSTSNTVVFPAASGGGSGLAVGGSSEHGGARQPLRRLARQRRQPARRRRRRAPATWFYERVWQVTVRRLVPRKRCKAGQARHGDRAFVDRPLHARPSPRSWRSRPSQF